MRVEKFNRHSLSEAERADLERLRQTIARTIASGSISQAERRELLDRIYADGIVTPYEWALFRELQDKVWRGELHID